MATFRAGVPVALTVIIALSACGRAGPDEDRWARAALARNATLEVVSSDPAAGTLTVRVKSTGELRTVHAGELIAALPPDASRPADQSAPTPAPVEAAPPPPPAASSPPPPSSAAPADEEPTTPQPSSPEVLRRAVTSSGRVLASGPGYSISDATSGPASAPTSKAGETLVSGPGYSIRDAGPGTPATPSGQAASTPADSPVRNVAVEQHHEPIICQGGRLLRIDGKNLEFDGDAVSAEGGCDLQITNSRIAAGGVAVAAHNANVRIENSLIDGGAGGAIVATDGAQIYAQQSMFKGVIRREDTAAFHDLGGNVGN
jgi:pyruvate/2-oxoglutarate dehydrogenase complex dihydrolipoamide acyltransferase (E2) component